MKKLLLIALFFFLPVGVEAEVIRSFVSDIAPGSDGGFSVVETIVYDFEGAERRGIFRVIPTGHSQSAESWLKRRVIEVESVSVLQDGEEARYELSHSGGNLTIKIGDPDVTLTGEHTYKITYRVLGGLHYYDSGEVDLYWNVTGHDWQVPILDARAAVHDPSSVVSTDSSCYFGRLGSNTECEVTENGAYVFGGVALDPGEGLTIAQALDPDRVNRQVIEIWALWPLWLVAALAWLIILSWYLYRYYIHHRTGAAIIAQYEPYGEFKPMYTGLLFDGRIDPHDITAGIVYLAEQGFFKITRIGRKKFFFIEVDDYKITLLRPISEVETDFQRQIFKLLFDERSSVGSEVVLSALAKDTSKQVENHKTLTRLHSAAAADLIKQGFFEYRWRTQIKFGGLLLGALAILLLLNWSMGADMVGPFLIAAATFVISSIMLALVYRRRTRKGYEALDYLKGFKLFLSVTDKERFKFHNAPQKSPEQFMEYLPYAIAFGVEKEWAEVFKDITIPQPDWYDGQGAAFNAIYLSQSLGTFGTTVASASGSSPASSGGGSAGGGAGGGGGGSW